MDGTSRIDELEQKFIENPRRYFAPLANEYRKAGNPHQAIAICRAHLGQLPGHMSGQIVYGQALFEGGEYEEARTVFENALAMDRENLVALKHLGDLALRDGQSAAARQWYAKILEIDPRDANVISLVNEIDAATEAQAATTDEQQPQAEPSAEKAEAAPEPPPPAPQAFASDEEDALISEELGYPVPPPQAFVTETMAELYLAQGFRDRALNVFRQLVALRPNDERLRARLNELESAEAPTEATAEETQPIETDSTQPEPIEAMRNEEVPLETPAVESRREEEPSVETPEPEPDAERAPSIEAPAPSMPDVQAPSEESPAFDTTPIDSPPDESSVSEPGSIEAPDREGPRAEPEGIAAHLTVREFFASLGRRRPSSSAVSSNGTSHSQNGRDPFATTPDDSDARAASALAGAFATPGQSAEPQASKPGGQTAGKESEEDVARFRAWLDGLTS